MIQEIETKVLDINSDEICTRLDSLGASRILTTRLIVDWYRFKDVEPGNDPWYLRIRSNSDGIHEVTWKARSEIIGIAAKHKEINITVSDPEKTGDFFESIGLVAYAHQEKDRVSYLYKEWRFDLDQYPGMPAYLEIEGTSDLHIKEAMTLLNISLNRTWSEGERKLIENVYGLNWHAMQFSTFSM